MSQSNIPLTSPQPQRVEKKSKVGQIDLTLFQTISIEQFNAVLEKVLTHDHSTN